MTLYSDTLIKATCFVLLALISFLVSHGQDSHSSASVSASLKDFEWDIAVLPVRLNAAEQ